MPSQIPLKRLRLLVSTVLAKGFVLGKVVNKAKSLDKRHHPISNASSTISTIDHKIGLTEKISVGTTVVNKNVREMDEKFQVSKIKMACIVAE